MKKHLLSFFLLCLFFSQQAFGQNVRYLDPIFDVKVTEDVIYGENFEVLTGAPILIDLLMDVYEPMDDTEAARPLVIMAHAGSFLPKGLNTLPFGSKRDSANIEMCREFAKRGYVCASINYRLGWNPLAPTQVDRAKSIIQATFRAAQDQATAIRFFDRDSQEDNNFRADAGKVIVAGNNSGGYTSLTVGYLNRPEEFQLFKFLDDDGVPFVQESVEGNLDGTGGNPALQNLSHEGFRSKAQLVLNLGGALGDLTWMDSTDNTALISFQEVNNPLTPYGTAVVIVTSTGDPIVEVSGGGDLHEHIADSGFTFNDKISNGVYDDPYTDGAKAAAASLNAPYYEGLYSMTSPTFFYDPWAWYDPADPNIDNTTPGASGFGSAANPFNTPETARIYIDTVINYTAPRACLVLDLPCADMFTSTEEVIKEPGRVAVFPNPAHQQFNLHSTKAGSPILGFQIFDLNGKQITNVQNIREYHIEVQVPDLIPGMYTVHARFEDGIVVEKLMMN
ncbi:MAG: T9SS type A sorting domain-containing protein [Bacteroidota bacterium]